MRIKVWHCYHYGKYETYVLTAETEAKLQAKVREMIALEWDEVDQGPMPDDIYGLLDAYNDYWSDRYFGCWDWSELEVDDCEKA